MENDRKMGNNSGETLLHSIPVVPSIEEDGDGSVATRGSNSTVDDTTASNGGQSLKLETIKVPSAIVEHSIGAAEWHGTSAREGSASVMNDSLDALNTSHTADSRFKQSFGIHNADINMKRGQPVVETPKPIYKSSGSVYGIRGVGSRYVMSADTEHDTNLWGTGTLVGMVPPSRQGADAARGAPPSPPARAGPSPSRTEELQAEARAAAVASPYSDASSCDEPPNPLLNEMADEERAKMEALVAVDPSTLSMEDMHVRIQYMVREEAAEKERKRLADLARKEPTIEEMIAMRQAMAEALEEQEAEQRRLEAAAKERQDELEREAKVSSPSRTLEFVPDGVELDEDVAEGFYADDGVENGKDGKPSRSGKHKSHKVASVREQLKHLSEYVAGHTNRKIMSSWNHVDARFKQSSLFYIEQRKNEDGRMQSIKHKALLLSDLTMVLCSTKVRVNYKELQNLYTTMNLTREQQYLSRRIAALRTVSQLMVGSKSKVKKKVDVELQVLMRETEPMTSIHELKDMVFPHEQKELNKWLKKIKEDGEALVRDHLHEQQKMQKMKDRAELRMKKAIADFSRALGEIQYSKGPLSIKRHAGLKSVLEYCQSAIKEAQREEEILIPHDLVNLLGSDVFPMYVQTSSGTSSGQRNRGMVRMDTGSKVLPLRFGGYGYFRLNIGRKGYDALASLKMCVSFGRGLNGYAYRDVVESLQAYATTRIQSAFRAWVRRQRYAFARKIWRRVHMLCKVSHFGAWRDHTRYFNAIRRRCFRKLRAWNFYVRNNKRRKAVFSSCFWPFYVWRRHVNEECAAREKARFLTSRVLPTYVLLRNFRAWKKFHVNKYNNLRKADTFHALQVRHLGGSMFAYLRRFAERRKGLRRSWLKEGTLMQGKRELAAKNTTFIIWHAYIVYMKMVKVMTQRDAPALAREALEKRQNRGVRRALGPGGKRERAAVRRALENAAADEENNLRRLAENDGGIMSKSRSQVIDEARKKRMGRAERMRLEAEEKRKEAERLREEREREAAEAAAARVDLTVEFKWELPIVRYHLESSKDNDEMHVPHSVIDIYDEAVIDLPVTDHLDFMVFADAWTRGRCDVLRLRFRQVARMAMLESGFRWHRLAHTALTHLRCFARVTKNARISQQEKRFERLTKAFTGLVMWTNRGDPSAPISMASGDQSAAEKLRNNLRINRLDKIRRRRAVNGEMKKRGLPLSPRTPISRKEKIRLQREADEAAAKAEELRKEKEEQEARDIMKAAFHGHGLKQQQRRQEQAHSHEDLEIIELQSRLAEEAKLRAEDEEKKAAAAKLAAEQADFKAPNIYDWDEEDRALDEKNMERIKDLSERFHSQAKDILISADAQSRELWMVEGMKDDALQKVNSEEAAVTRAATEAEITYADEFKLHAARLMLDRLYVINEDVKQLLMRRAVRSYFRQLRLPRLLAVSKIMCHRKQLTNWIRLCKRLAAVYATMPFYRERRTKWVIFMRWLKLVELNRVGCTHGLVNELKLRRYTFLSYDEYLQYSVDPPIPKSVYFMNKRVQREVATVPALFARWKTYSVENYFFRKMFTVANRWRILKVLERCFWSLRRVGTKGIVGPLLKKYPTPMLQRCAADFDQIGKRFCALRKKTTHYITSLWNRKFIFRYRKLALLEPTFKQFMYQLIEEGKQRALAEQRMLVTAFESRGSLEFEDVRAPTDPEEVGISLAMQRSDGIRISDPRLPDCPKDKHATDVPAGFRITKVRIVSQQGLGIVGWQLQWGADSMPNKSGKRRGKWLGGQLSFEEIDVPENDFVLGLDYQYEGSNVLCLRLHYLINGSSKWYGYRTSRSVLTQTIMCDTAERLPFQDNFRSAGWDEDHNPALPREYVIGLACHEGATRLTNVQLVTRKVDQQDIFSYTWVDDGIARLEEKLRKEEELRLQIEEEARMEKLQAMMEAGGVHIEAPEDESNGLPPIAASVVSESDADSDLDDGEQEDEPERGVGISRHEEEFFDVIRMRNSEVSEAQRRAEMLARRIWRSYELRDPTHPLAPLTTVRIVSAICAWMFSAISRRLTPMPRTEMKAQKLKQEGRVKLLKSEVADRRAFGLHEMAENLSKAKHPWTGLKLLNPEMKAKKLEMQDTIRRFRKESKEFTKQAEDMRIASAALLLEGRLLTPRLQLSHFTLANYRIKVAGARHKASLLEQMDLKTMRNALCGKSVDSGISDGDMDLLRSSLRMNTSFGNQLHDLKYITDVAVDASRDKVGAEDDLKEREERKKQELITRMRTGGTMADREKLKGKVATTRNLRSIDPPGQVLKKKVSREHAAITLKKLDWKNRLMSRSLTMSRGELTSPEGSLANSSRHNLVEIGSNYYIDIPFSSKTDDNASIGLGPLSARHDHDSAILYRPEGGDDGPDIEALDSNR